MMLCIPALFLSDHIINNCYKEVISAEIRHLSQLVES